MLGQTISQYEIVDKVGEGGMGVVYRARDTLLHRFVAIKALNVDRAADVSRKRRFLQEARAASALNHPGIVTIHQIVAHEGLDYIVMELVEGRPLAELIPETGMPFEKVVEIGTQMAEAMAAAHRADIVHRDLKPQNVMVADSGRVKILDFGVAKLNPRAGGGNDLPTITGSITQAGVAIGTLSYMSPEQALGEPVDGRSDIFSLGSVLYHMLTGKPPFRGAHAAALLHELHYGDPEKIRDLRGEIPEALEAMVERALLKAPGERYPRMEDLASDLGSLRPPPETSSSGILPVKTPSRRPGRRWIGIAVGVGLLLVTVLFLTRSSGRDARALLPAAAAESREGDAFTLYQRGQRLLERYDKESHLRGAVEALQQAVALDPEFAAAHALLAKALWARYHAENKDRLWLDRAASHGRRALELDEHLAVAHTSLALVKIELGDPQEALGLLESARMLDPMSFEVPLVEGKAHQAAGDLAEAEAAFRRAVELGAGHREPHDYLGSVLVQQGRAKEAEEAFRRAIEVAPDCYISHRNLAGVYQLQGSYDAAASALQRSLEIRPTWSGYSNLGTLHFSLGRYEEAVRAYEKALELGANDYRVWGNLADAYRWTPGNRSRATTALRRALQLLHEKMSDAPEEPTLKSRRALFLAKVGDCPQALAEIGALEPLPAADAALQVRGVQVYELCGQRPKALKALEGALRAGSPEEEIRRDPELTQLRRDVEYHLLVARVSNEDP